MSTFEDQQISAQLSIAENLLDAVRRHHDVTLGYIGDGFEPGYLYRAVAIALRDRLIPHWRRTRELSAASDCRKVSYFSL